MIYILVSIVGPKFVYLSFCLLFVLLIIVCLPIMIALSHKSHWANFLLSSVIFNTIITLYYYYSFSSLLWILVSLGKYWRLVCVWAHEGDNQWSESRWQRVALIVYSNLSFTFSSLSKALFLSLEVHFKYRPLCLPFFPFNGGRALLLLPFFSENCSIRLSRLHFVPTALVWVKLNYLSYSFGCPNPGDDSDDNAWLQAFACISPVSLSLSFAFLCFASILSHSIISHPSLHSH